MKSCRLCDGRVSTAFELTILDRHDVIFFRCEDCGSLQSDTPYWLDEAYEAAISSFDTGAIHRNLITQAAVFAIAKVLRADGRMIDFGGGFGVLCRLLRDIGFDAYLYDKYADPVFARAFTLDPGDAGWEAPTILTAFEVLEHFSNPAEDVGSLFSLNPDIFIASTVVYRGEGRDWWYLSPQTGQHVFFYSNFALEMIARKANYYFLSVDDVHIFSKKKIGYFRGVILRMLLSRLGKRMTRVWIAAGLRGTHVEADYRALRGAQRAGKR